MQPSNLSRDRKKDGVRTHEALTGALQDTRSRAIMQGANKTRCTIYRTREGVKHWKHKKPRRSPKAVMRVRLPHGSPTKNPLKFQCFEGFFIMRFYPPTARKRGVKGAIRGQVVHHLLHHFSRRHNRKFERQRSIYH